MPYVLGLDAVVLGDGGVSSGAVGRYAYVGDLDSVSRCGLVVRVREMSLSGGGDAVVSGVDESVCGVNSVLADGILDLCGVSC